MQSYYYSTNDKLIFTIIISFVDWEIYSLLLGHEGPGSLLSELKSRGWVNNLVGGQKSGAKELINNLI